MKKLLLLSALLILGCTNNNYKNFLEQENLKGNVKIMVSKSFDSYEEKFGEPSGSGFLFKQTFDFDKNGNLKIAGGSYGDEDFIVKYEYDDRTFLKIKNFYLENGLHRRTKYKYYNDGKLKSEEIYYSDGQNDKESSDFYEYEENGNIKIKNGSGDTKQIITFENNLKRIAYVGGSRVKEFNENGDLDKDYENKEKGLAEYYKYIKFDNEGNWLVRYSEDNDGNRFNYTEREIIYY